MSVPNDLFASDARFVDLATTHWPTEPRFVCAEDPTTYEDVVVQLTRNGWEWQVCEGAVLRRNVVSHWLLGGPIDMHELPMQALLWRKRERPLEDHDAIAAAVSYATTPILYFDHPQAHYVMPRRLQVVCDGSDDRLYEVTSGDDVFGCLKIAPTAAQADLAYLRAEPPSPLTHLPKRTQDTLF